MTVSIRNALIVALLQVGVVVAGVLGVETGYFLDPDKSAFIQSLPGWLHNYGVVCLLIPPVWFCCFGWASISDGERGKIRKRIFWAGILVLLALALVMGYAMFGVPYYRRM